MTFACGALSHRTHLVFSISSATRAEVLAWLEMGIVRKDQPWVHILLLCLIVVSLPAYSL